jgi:hypothetical protein
MTEASYTIEHIQGDTLQTYTTDELAKFKAVDSGDFETSTSPMISEGFYNCIGLIGLSKNSALLGHFQSIDTPGLGSYAEFNDAIKTLLKIQAHTVILVAGGMFDNPNDVEYATADRAFAEKAVHAAFPSTHVVVNWNEDYHGRQDIIVFPDSGKIAIYNTTTTFVV